MTDDWTAGYVADIAYTHGYYPELNPLRARLALLHAGFVCPEFRNACELGFGQGLSVNVHAAASAVAWTGTDFNPSQAAFAQELAMAAGSGARLFDEAFAEFAARPDLPSFDFIGLHGIWSWISDDNRAVITEFVRKRLRVGGVLYVSYNALPGWAAFAPVRRLMVEHAEVIGAKGSGIVSRIEGSIEFVKELLACSSGYVQANPNAKERLARLSDQDRAYLAHEYFNRDWEPMHFASMAHRLEPAKLQYACSAHLLDHFDPINLGGRQREMLKSITDPVFRETVRDFMVNQQFRRDFWIKGARRLSPLERAEGLRKCRFTLGCQPSELPAKIRVGLGEVKLKEGVSELLANGLADQVSLSIEELFDRLSPRDVSFESLVETLVILCGTGHVLPAQEASEVRQAAARTLALNRRLMDRARSGAEVGHLASPVSGGGIAVGRIQQLFLASLAEGGKGPSEWASSAWQVLQFQGQRLVKEGRSLVTPEENVAELFAMASAFAGGQLPVLRRLGIASPVAQP